MVDCADNLEQRAISAYLVGRYDESDWAWTRAHRMRLAAGDLTGALRCAFWLAFRLVNEGDLVGGHGWIARIEGLLEDNPGGPADHARLAYLTGRLARRSQDTELAALAGLALGRVLIFRGEARRGVRLVDEAMLAVAIEPLSPIAVGDSYCPAIDASHDLFDVLRGQARTDALTRWCPAARRHRRAGGYRRSPRLTLLDAIMDRARGAVLLSEHDARRALVPLRQAGNGFREIGTPYETARTCVLVGQARRELGDDEGAQLELDAARSVFEPLGARPELARLDVLSPVPRDPMSLPGPPAREHTSLSSVVSTGRYNPRC